MFNVGNFLRHRNIHRLRHRRKRLRHHRHCHWRNLLRSAYCRSNNCRGCCYCRNCYMSCCYFCGRCHYYCCCKMEKPLRRPLWYPTILCGRKFLRWLSDSSPKDDSSGKRSWSFRRAGSFRRRNLHRSRCSDNIRSKGCNCCYPVCRTRRSAECGSGRRHPSKAGSNPDHPSPNSCSIPSNCSNPSSIPTRDRSRVDNTNCNKDFPISSSSCSSPNRAIPIPNRD